MSITTVNFIAQRIEYAEKRWMDAMLRPGYRDDPEEALQKGQPFTQEDWKLYKWADSWRLLVHKYENGLDHLPEAARARALSFSQLAYSATYINAEQSMGHLSTLAPSGNKKR